MPIQIFADEIVRNSWFEGVWGTEERGGPMLFHKDKEFLVTIDVEQSGYRVRICHSFYDIFFFEHPIPLLIKQIRRIESIVE